MLLELLALATSSRVESGMKTTRAAARRPTRIASAGGTCAGRRRGAAPGTDGARIFASYARRRNAGTSVSIFCRVCARKQVNA